MQWHRSRRKNIHILERVQAMRVVVVEHDDNLKIRAVPISVIGSDGRDSGPVE